MKLVVTEHTKINGKMMKYIWKSVSDTTKRNNPSNSQ